MNRLNEITQREAELIHLQEVLEHAPDDPFARPLLESRLRSLKREIDKLKVEVFPTPETDLYFVGGPALGSMALDANFVSQILESYPNIITNQFAASHGVLRSFGRRQLENASRLYLTALPRGSFGLRLAQPNQDNFADAEEVVEIMAKIPGLLAGAAAGDAEFDNALEFFHPRVLKPLQRFVEAIANGKGGFQIVSGSEKLELTHDQLIVAKDRVEAARENEDSEEIKGTFGGNLLQSRKFELQPFLGSLIEGSLSKDVGDEIAREWIHLGGSLVSAFILVTTVTTRSGPKKPRYELLDLKPLTPAEMPVGSQ